MRWATTDARANMAVDPSDQWDEDAKFAKQASKLITKATLRMGFIKSKQSQEYKKQVLKHLKEALDLLLGLQ